MNLIELLQLEDLDEEQRHVAELIGMENYRKLVEAFGGVYLYIPKTDRYEKAARNEAIRREFDGGNFQELALKYSLTETWVRSIVSDLTQEVRRRPIEGQTSFY